MKPAIRLKFSVMMFLEFFIWGSWYVTGPNYLGALGFKAEDFGWTYSVGPIAGMISPFFVGMIADRFFPAQRVLAAMHFIGAALMLYATTLMKAGAAPTAINGVFFGYMLTYFPTLALTNTLAMKNMTNPEKEFPLIRVLGTIGWIAAGLTLSWLGWDKTINMFYLTAGAALLLGFFSLALPHTPPVGSGPVSARQILGLDALVMLKNRSYLTFMVASALICIPLAFYYQITSRVVEMTGLPIGQTMSYGQMSEIVFMLIMPLFFARLGVKWMLAVGMLAWVVRYGLFAIGASEQIQWMIILGIVLHGICYDFFLSQVRFTPIRPRRKTFGRRLRECWFFSRSVWECSLVRKWRQGSRRNILPKRQCILQKLLPTKLATLKRWRANLLLLSQPKPMNFANSSIRYCKTFARDFPMSKKLRCTRRS